MASIPALAAEVKPAVEDHPRIGRIRWQDRVYNFASLNLFTFIKTNATDGARFMNSIYQAVKS